jgi:hypothetical protein
MTSTIVAEYCSFVATKTASKELEIKLSLDDEVFRSLYTKIIDLAESSCINQSLNTVTDVNPDTGMPLKVDDRKKFKSREMITDRKEITFVAAKKVKESCMRKTKLHYGNVHHGSVKYQLAFSKEESIQTINMSTVTQIRLKYRSSIIITDHPDWRFDFTIVKLVTPDQFQNIATIRDAWFGKQVDVKDFLNRLTPDAKTELEIEYIGQSVDPEQLRASIDSVMTTLTNLLDPDAAKDDAYHKIIAEIADLVIKDKKQAKSFKFKNTLKQLVNQPLPLDPATYRNHVVPAIQNYWIADKADGERCIVYITHEQLWTVSTTEAVSYPLKSSDTIVLDTERVGDTYYVFDCIFKTTPMEGPFSERLAAVAEICGKFNAIALVPKQMSRLDTKTAGKLIKQFYSNKKYEVDGLIFTPESDSYFDAIVYKWKPPERQTVDCLVMRAPDSVLGIEPYIPKAKHTLMFLFNGINIETFKKLGLTEPRGYDEIFPQTSPTFFPAALMPSSNPLAYMYYHPDTCNITADQLNGHVAELGIVVTGDRDTLEWVFHKLRSDRDSQVSKGIGYGNAYKTAELIYENYRNPFTFEMLTDFKQLGSYFNETKSVIYKPVTRFNGFVKSMILRQLESMDLVIDLAGGHGQDLFVLDSLGVKNVLFIDKDKEALVEINVRKYHLGESKYYVFGTAPKRHPNLWTMEADLTEPATAVSNKIQTSFPIRAASAGGVVMNFAIHYIVNSVESRQNLFDLVNMLVKPGGVFIFTCFDGRRVYEFLESTETGKTMDLTTDDGTSKFSIRKDYDNAAKFEPYGLKIGVVHPFSSGEYYQETLLDLAWVLSIFKEQNWTIIQNSSFGDWIDRYQKFDKAIPLDRSDKIYASLYSYCSVAKPRK